MTTSDGMVCWRKTKGQECGGALSAVNSESGITWGFRCQRCRRFVEKCQGCGRVFLSLATHLNPTAKDAVVDPMCFANNQAHRTAQAVRKMEAP